MTNMFTPYWIPLLNEISRLAGERGWQFRAVALCDRESNRRWELGKDEYGFEYAILPGWQGVTSERGGTPRLNRGAFKALWDYSPDVVITSGYDAIAYWQAFIYAKVTGRKFILRSGTTLLSMGSNTGIRGRLKKFIVEGADGFIAYGTKAKEYLESLGADSYRIKICLNTVDMKYFRDRALQVRAGEGFKERRAGFPELLLLYSGQLIERKGLSRVLLSLGRLKDRDIGLIILGSGPQEAELKRLCGQSGLTNVYFEGFRNQEELPGYYALADALVLPSIEEAWGLVVNEALASGQYVLCSKYAGAGYDLITQGFNGELIDPDDTDGLTESIKSLKDNIGVIKERRDEISRRADEEFGVEISARGFIEAASQALGTP
ncbi:MAG: glycosyltransferase family 4 protein [Nitrospirota bacterium]